MPEPDTAITAAATLRPILRGLRLPVLWAMVFLAGAACEKLPPSGPPTAAERQLVEQRVEAYFRRAVEVGANVSMVLKDVTAADMGLLHAQLELSNGTQTQKIPLVVSRDGRYLIQGRLTDLTADPLQATMDKISLADVAARGDPKAPVTIVEYSDFQCPFCAQAYKTLEEQVLPVYGTKVRLIFKNFPLAMHPWAEPAAIASVCARQQSNEAYWKLYDYLFANQKDLSSENLEDRAVGLLTGSGIDPQAFRQCVGEKKGLAQVQAEAQEATSIGVRSTPTFFINGRKLEGALPVERFRAAIEEALRRSTDVNS